eukprot:gnl/Carplike_NY0171/4229_a5728_291.p1 GENE.gnl/Carplike_NY0171/4229_a5728_291~~gnl/Carplike_NY0171/4229_a5728_291.p1  ORF type:complete len:668 (-),score=186.65 gnl/Carplike_NY0171/4229_a5728_291:59-1789(-)
MSDITKHNMYRAILGEDNLKLDVFQGYKAYVYECNCHGKITIRCPDADLSISDFLIHKRDSQFSPFKPLVPQRLTKREIALEGIESSSSSTCRVMPTPFSRYFTANKFSIVAPSSLMRVGPVLLMFEHCNMSDAWNPMVNGHMKDCRIAIPVEMCNCEFPETKCTCGAHSVREGDGQGVSLCEGRGFKYVTPDRIDFGDGKSFADISESEAINRMNENVCWVGWLIIYIFSILMSNNNMCFVFSNEDTNQKQFDSMLFKAKRELNKILESDLSEEAKRQKAAIQAEELVEFIEMICQSGVCVGQKHETSRCYLQLFPIDIVSADEWEQKKRQKEREQAWKGKKEKTMGRSEYDEMDAVFDDQEIVDDDDFEIVMDSSEEEEKEGKEHSKEEASIEVETSKEEEEPEDEEEVKSETKPSSSHPSLIPLYSDNLAEYLSTHSIVVILRCVIELIVAFKYTLNCSFSDKLDISLLSLPSLFATDPVQFKGSLFPSVLAHCMRVCVPLSLDKKIPFSMSTSGYGWNQRPDMPPDMKISISCIKWSVGMSQKMEEEEKEIAKQLKDQDILEMFELIGGLDI